MAGVHLSRQMPVSESVAKSIIALNHKGTKTTKEKLFFVLFVPVWFPFFSGPFATTSFAGKVMLFSRVAAFQQLVNVVFLCILIIMLNSLIVIRF